ncbi:hypothetical protein E2C01_012968 [Portunus trituberculatus]|uniref:Uncharacterized protein n=1 Tax=Portunus trituberculatus TaxID=210409 RepID=A0A5B7DFE5_PORTR|nr:hypothetical protein [Portunus trituberculatus]
MKKTSRQEATAIQQTGRKHCTTRSLTLSTRVDTSGFIAGLPSVLLILAVVLTIAHKAHSNAPPILALEGSIGAGRALHWFSYCQGCFKAEMSNKPADITEETLTAVKLIGHVGAVKLPITAPGGGQAAVTITKEKARRAGATLTLTLSTEQHKAVQSMQNTGHMWYRNTRIQVGFFERGRKHVSI